jgi:hypothetical protein
MNKENPETFVKSIEVVVPPDKKTGRGYKDITSSTYNLVNLVNYTKILSK